MKINTEKDIISIMKKTLKTIEEKYFIIWQKELEYEITYSFMFKNAYFAEKKEKNNKIIYELVNAGGLHDINGYKTVSSFLKTLTGEPGWDDNYGLRTYYIRMKENWIKTLIDTINNNLEENNVTSDNLMIEENEEVRNIFIQTVEKFWTILGEQNFKEVIEKNVMKVLEEDKEMSMILDMKMIEQEKRFELFQPIILDFLNYFNIKEIVYLEPTEKAILNKVQQWAKLKNYEELSLFDEFYPKNQELYDFKWLDTKIYKTKMKEKKEINDSISFILEENGISVKDDIISNRIKKLYELREHIFMVNGEKNLIIHGQDESFQFYIDKYNRVNGNENGISDLTKLLEECLEDIGSIILKKTDEDKSNIPSFSIYGAMLLKGDYKGLSAEEMHNIYTLAQISSISQEKVEFFDWNIGSWNESW